MTPLRGESQSSIARIGQGMRRSRGSGRGSMLQRHKAVWDEIRVGTSSDGSTLGADAGRPRWAGCYGE